MLAQSKSDEPEEVLKIRKLSLGDDEDTPLMAQQRSEQASAASSAQLTPRTIQEQQQQEGVRTASPLSHQTPVRAEEKELRQPSHSQANIHRLDKASLGGVSDTAVSNGMVADSFNNTNTSSSSLANNLSNTPTGSSVVARDDGHKGSENTGSSYLSVARPHHLPKLDSLSKRMDEIRRTMGDQVLGIVGVYFWTDFHFFSFFFQMRLFDR